MNFPIQFQQFEAPFAWLDLDAFEHNIEKSVEMSDALQIRIATKSIRSVPLLKLLQEKLGEKCAGFMTFTASETNYLCKEGFDHFLLGYPSMEKDRISQLVQWIVKGKDIVFMVDKIEHVAFLQEIAQAENCTVRICIDLNVSDDYRALYFGTRRSSISTRTNLLRFLQQLRHFRHIQVVGLMGYDAQIAGVGDRSPNTLKNKLIDRLKRRATTTVQQSRMEAIELCNRLLPKRLQFVNGGGSGSIRYTASCNEVTEVTIGSAYFKPALFDAYKEMPFKPSAGFALRVTRKPMEHTIVVHGGGLIASGAVGRDKMPKPLDASLSYYSQEGAGEVQTPLKLNGKPYRIGDLVHFRHSKAGELCERFQVLHSFQRGKYVGPISTYRGDEQCFL